MFWKKRKTNKKPLFDFASSNQRNAFRYRHDDNNRPEITFLGKKVHLLDISASGTSFKAENFSPGDIDNVKLDLNDPDTKKQSLISLKIKIVSKDDNTCICHCCFENITEHQKNLIHQYILDKQKKAIKKKSQTIDSSH